MDFDNGRREFCCLSFLGAYFFPDLLEAQPPKKIPDTHPDVKTSPTKQVAIGSELPGPLLKYLNARNREPLFRKIKSQIESASDYALAEKAAFGRKVERHDSAQSLAAAHLKKHHSDLNLVRVVLVQGIVISDAEVALAEVVIMLSDSSIV